MTRASAYFSETVYEVDRQEKGTAAPFPYHREGYSGRLLVCDACGYAVVKVRTRLYREGVWCLPVVLVDMERDENVRI
jgi:hypothetical protein